jgi:hypothetical protein
MGTYGAYALLHKKSISSPETPLASITPMVSAAATKPPEPATTTLSADQQIIEGFLRGCDYDPIPDKWNDPTLNIAFGDVSLRKVSFDAQGDLNLEVTFEFEGHLSDAELGSGARPTLVAHLPSSQDRTVSHTRASPSPGVNSIEVAKMKEEAMGNHLAVSCSVTRTEK